MMGHFFSKMTRFRRKSRKRCKQLKTTFRFNRIEVNALISMDGYENVSQLWLAVRFDDEALATGLVEIGADVNLVCGGLLMSPLHLAVGNQNIEMLKMLLEAGAKPDVMDKWNYTPLMYAAIHYDASIVNDLFKVLLQHGADVNFGACIDKSGNVINARNVDLFELRSGGECDYITYVKDPMGPTSGTALHHALQNPHLPNESIEVLLHNAANIDLPNLYGQTCLMGVLRDVYYDYHSNVKSHAQLLLSEGANLNAKDRRGWTCFHYAAQRGSISGMELLLSANGDCNMSSNVGETPLWLLLVYGWREASEYLIRSGCDVNRPASSHIILNINQNVDICRYGDICPLEFALCNRYYKIAKLIVTSNGDIDLNTWLGSQGATPSAEHVQFMDFLNEHLNRRKSVKSLLECCRDSFRKTSKQGIVLKLKSIVLPQSLKEFISLGSVTYPLEEQNHPGKHS